MDLLTKESEVFLKELDLFLRAYTDRTTIEDGRQAYEELAQKWGAPRVEMAEVRDFQVPSPYTPEAGSVSIRLYRPEASPDPLPVLIYTHGGGWVRGSIEAYDTKCRLLAQKLGWVVISVGYQRAPEFKFPTPLNQLQAVYEWVQENALSLKINPRDITLSGDSGGGNITTGFVCRLKQQNRPLPQSLLLFYPCLDMRVDSPSVSLYGKEGYFLTAENIRIYRDHYLKDSATEKFNPEASPVLFKDVSGFPPTVLVTAGCDPLRSENEDFASHLKDYGVPISFQIYPGVLHAFTLFYKMFPEAEEALHWSTQRLLDLRKHT